MNTKYETRPICENAALLLHGKLAAAMNAKDWNLYNNPNPCSMSQSQLIDTYSDPETLKQYMKLIGVTNLETCNDFHGQTRSLFQNSDPVNFHGEDLVYIPCNNRANLFEQAYDNKSEIKEEFVNLLSKYDFMDIIKTCNVNIDDYIVSINGVCAK